ncbi:MAG: AraC family transcriptional regulator [Ferruginibacter sp.]
MMIQLSLSSGELLLLKQSPGRKFRGLRIPGSVLYKSEKNGASIDIHWFNHRLYAISLRQIQRKDEGQIITTEENRWLRLEIPLSGALTIIPKDGSSFQLDPGHYHLTDQLVYASEHPAGIPAIYFTVHFSPELLAGIGSDQAFTSIQPAPVPQDLLEMVYDILKCPFQESLRNFYFANKVRDILFSHTVSIPVVMRGELTPDQIAQMYEADRIMAHNLDGKITIPELARKLGTNFVSLKKNYEKLFGIGIFPRLMQRKMEHIQLLLEKTNKPLKEIADLAGYQTLPGFINAFRKRFKITPKEWRNKRRGFNYENDQ